MTTNENSKWADLREDVAEGLVWRARIEDLRGDFVGLWEGSGDGEGECVRGAGKRWPIEPSWLVITMEEPGRRPRVRRRKDTLGRKRAGGQEEEMHGAVLVQGGGDVGSRREQQEDGYGQWEEDRRWTQVRSLNEIENIYDLGFWDNLKDVIFNRE